MNVSISLEDLFRIHKFEPNEGQLEAIKTLDGPLFLMAGPGSGKTRVLLWRTVNAIVFQNVNPENIFCLLYGEGRKAIKRWTPVYIRHSNKYYRVPYDISRMYVGTVHSLCQRIIADRRFIKQRSRVKPPILMDELDQYFLSTPVVLEYSRRYPSCE